MLYGSLDSNDMRASVVVGLLEGGMLEQAFTYSLPLVGTEYNALFLLVRAWQRHFEGNDTEAEFLLIQAFQLAGLDSPLEFCSSSFALSDSGHPQVDRDFLNSLSSSVMLVDGEGVSQAVTELASEDWASIYRCLRVEKSSFLSLASSAVGWIESLLHHDTDSFQCAVEFLEEEVEIEREDRLFLLFTTTCDESRKIVLEALWRSTVDWDFPLPCCELACFMFWLEGDDANAEIMAARGLEKDPGSLVCGNIRALTLSYGGKPYLADEQWRATLEYRPNRATTYLVLGGQALSAGSVELSLRYYLEALATGDNRRECERMLNSVLELEE